MCNTRHRVYFTAAQNMRCIQDASIDLVVTSPPYPMIEMWDDIMTLQNPAIGEALQTNPKQAFELMHRELDQVWAECYRLLKDGGMMCINIGDATRTLNKEFQLYNNHTRITDACLTLGFTNLPNIIWRKQTNSPNKFMGSGMLPCGAYVTLEHEWILVFRKGGKRDYTKACDKQTRRESSFFWEERNKWFSDLWEIKGVKQKINHSQTRERNASFPLEIPFRLINMYSQRGDTVLDPFFGLGTTTIAAMLSGRHSIGVEIDRALEPSIRENIENLQIDELNRQIRKRYENHLVFVETCKQAGKELKHYNENLHCPVVTSQEVEMMLHYVNTIAPIESDGLAYECSYFEELGVEPFILSNNKYSLFYHT